LISFLIAGITEQPPLGHPIGQTHRALKRKKIEAGSLLVGTLMLAERSSFADGAASRSVAGHAAPAVYEWRLECT
jgi:hypothetical protein